MEGIIQLMLIAHFILISLSFKQIVISVISQCIQLLVADLECACEPALVTMAKVFDCADDQYGAFFNRTTF